MKQISCPLCKTSMIEGETDLTMRRDRSIVVVEGVPALVCPQCGEASVSSEISEQAYSLAEDEIRRGVALELCRFKAA